MLFDWLKELLWLIAMEESLLSYTDGYGLRRDPKDQNEVEDKRTKNVFRKQSTNFERRYYNNAKPFSLVMIQV